MALEDFLSDLGGGGLQGAGAGGAILGGMGLAKIGMASNPWVAGGLIGGGALLGILGSDNSDKQRAMRLNNQLGDQELEMNRLSIRDTKTKQALEAQKRHTWDQFGGMFSNYLSSMAQAKPTGQAAFNASLGGP